MQYAKISSAQEFERDSQSFLAAISASPDVQYTESTGVVGLDQKQLDSLCDRGEAVHLHTPAKAQIDLITQCMSLLSEWADVIKVEDDSSSGSMVGRVSVSSLHD